VNNTVSKSELRARRRLGPAGALRMVRYRTLETGSPVSLRPFVSPMLEEPESGRPRSRALTGVSYLGRAS
jgi:hypothetical protein